MWLYLHFVPKIPAYAELASSWKFYFSKVKKEPVAVWKQALFRLQCNVVMKYVHGKKRRMVRDNRTCTLELYD